MNELIRKGLDEEWQVIYFKFPAVVSKITITKTADPDLVKGFNNLGIYARVINK